MNCKILIVFMSLLLLCGCGLAPVPAAHARDYYDDYSDYESDDVVAYFRDDLAPYGEWFRYGSYGWVWRPYDVVRGWRPYTVGHWILTDAGWTWVSDEPWGWAPFHYGRWFYDPFYGWVWLPGRQWAPAWVVWHRGHGWIGWAPLPPWGRWRTGIGIPRDVYVEPAHFCFVEERYIVEPQVARYIAPPERNVTIVHTTQNITNYTVVHNRVINNSVKPAEVERVVGHPVERHRVEQVERAAPRPLHVKRHREGPLPRAKERERAREEAPTVGVPPRERKKATPLAVPTLKHRERVAPPPERHREGPAGRTPHGKRPGPPAPRPTPAEIGKRRGLEPHREAVSNPHGGHPQQRKGSAGYRKPHQGKGKQQ
jgi:hypothetical protein